MATAIWCVRAWAWTRIHPRKDGHWFAALRTWFVAAFITASALIVNADAVEPARSASTNPHQSNWWSLRPLVRPPLPGGLPGEGLVSNPVDAFIRAKLAEKGLRPSAEADRTTLIRRLYFDLIGLPPKPEEVQAFTSDPDPLAYYKWVDRLLASPQYGERWARHWLDVVHYGETHGYDKDKPRPNAWPYRDYVIRSFNADKPYGRFVREQIAGDVLFPGTRDGFEALGFISAGPWDFIGHVEVPESKTDGKVARHLDRDDMVVNTLQTFNSVTVQCAQCHNHKFDPISQEDYYCLQAVFSALDRADQAYDTDGEVAERRASLQKKEQRVLTQKEGIDRRVRARAGQPLVDIEAEIARIPEAKTEGEAIGYHSGIETQQETVKWVQVDLDRSVAIREVVLHACHDDFNGIGDGFGFPLRFRVEISDDPQFATEVQCIVDNTGSDVPNPRLKPVQIPAGTRTGRFVRMTATRLAPRQNDFIFALAELEVRDADGKNVAMGKPVTALDSIEAPARWKKRNLTDGGYPGFPGQTQELSRLQATRNQLLAAIATGEETVTLEKLAGELERIRHEISRLPPQSTAFVGAVYTGSGNYVGTGAGGGVPRPIHLLARGNVLSPGREVSPGALSCLAPLTSRFDLPPNAGEGARRVALAKWLTDRENPLSWRSIVNRIWQYHFGRGLVETSNDFGRMGALPTHPELLDWLAVEFRDGGQSMKAMHRLIVTSETYRQTSNLQGSNPGPEERSNWELAAQIDSDNRFLWRQNRRKLEAEAIRDAVLSVSGTLNLSMGGPSFQDFVIEHPDHSPHYEYDLHDPEDPVCHRRSVYRFIVRSQPEPFMTLLDCPDPSMQVAKRNESLSALQALSLLNNSFILAMSHHFAARLEFEGKDVRDQVDRGYQLAVGHRPSSRDAAALIEFTRENGLPNLCRLLLNLNEFSFAD